MSLLKQFIFFFFLLASSSFAQNTADIIIPKPQSLQIFSGEFLLTDTTTYCSDSVLANNALNYLQAHLKQSSNYTLQKSSCAKENTIHFAYAPHKSNKKEAYRLHIANRSVTITAADEAGFFYGIVSLMQLMDAAIWQTDKAKPSVHSWNLPACSIDDYPRFEWRGMMLDSSRNFFEAAYIKKFIDRMAQFKLNRFHWHLSDDEGWRIEIRHYPLLTQIGAKRGDGTQLAFSIFPTMKGIKRGVESGYYTQQEIREIVAYAKARSIEILPEIDLPAHSKAAVTAYPDLLQDPLDASQYRSVQQISNNTLNPALESSYKFIDDVIGELAQLFPFGTIHIGGDEIPKGAWQKSPAVARLIQKEGLKNLNGIKGYFFERVDAILAKHHRTMIAWEEASQVEAKLRKETRFMAWKSPKSGEKLLSKSHQVIMTPVQYLYFDQKYSGETKEPGHSWSTPVSTQKVYSFGTIANSPHLKGVQASLWSERLFSEKIADYMAWPRALALSEIAWSDKKRLDWEDFKIRAYTYGTERLKAQKINFRKSNGSD